MAGKKFNSKKETVEDEDYLGIKIFRFYMKCPRCSSQFTIRTDPENADYKAEWGCTRNFEPWKEDRKAYETAKAAQEEDEEGDAMKALENRTKESRREMDILDGLSEIRALNARNSKLSVDDVLAAQRERVVQNEETGIDTDEARRAFEEARRKLDPAKNDKDDDDDDDEEDEAERLEKLFASKKRQREEAAKQAAAAAAATADTAKSDTTAKAPSKEPGADDRVEQAAKKSRVIPLAATATVIAKKKKPAAAGLSLLNAYGSDSDASSS